MASRHIKREKGSLPVDVQCPKKLLLKHPNEPSRACWGATPAHYSFTPQWTSKKRQPHVYVTRRYCCFQVSSVLESLLSAFIHRSQNTGYSSPVLAPFSLSRNVWREGLSLQALRDREREGPELDNGYSCRVMKISNKLHQVHVAITIIIFGWFLQEHYQNYLRMISSIYRLYHDSRLKLF